MESGGGGFLKFVKSGHEAITAFLIVMRNNNCDCVASCLLADVCFGVEVKGRINGCHARGAGSRGQSGRPPPESGFEQLGEMDSTHAVRRDTSEAPLVNPSLSPSFIWEYDLYFLK